MRQRLHGQIFGALLLTGLLCTLVAGVAAYFLHDDPTRNPGLLRDVGEFIVDELPRDDPRAFNAGLRRRAKRLHASISVWDHQGRLVGQAGRKLRGPRERRGKGMFEPRDHAVFVTLEDGRSVAVSIHGGPLRLQPPRLFVTFAIMLLVLLLGSHWAARRIARRLEALEAGVSRLGRGELDVRVSERGHDEIARLARAFNLAAARILGLLRTQRRMLQSASHELRSPLSRLRMAHELLSADDVDSATRNKLAQESARDIDELDVLIGDLLLAARLEDPEQPKQLVSLDLWPLVQEEAKRVNAEAHGSSHLLSADARMLRSLLRNLLENARRYGRDPIEIRLERDATELLVVVQDRGDGVAEADRERIFEPFYRPAGHREGKDGGVGLGLALVRAIAGHHGGNVRYAARDGGGSRFEVRLPAKGNALRDRTAPSAGA